MISTVGIVDVDRVELLETALARLPADHLDRAFVLAALCKELLFGSPLERRQAKDLLRASGLDLLPTDNAHVAADLAKVKRGESLSPVLLVRGEMRRGVPLTIADGYHRVCASYHLDENADIPCHLADFGAP